MSKMKIVKITTIFILIFIILGSVQVMGVGDPFSNPGDWEPTYEEDTVIVERAGKIFKTINVIGVIVALLVLVIIGIKFIFGSIEEKAEYKKTLLPYIIGVFLLVTATTLPNLIYIFTSGVLKNV